MEVNSGVPLLIVEPPDREDSHHGSKEQMFRQE